MPVEPQNDTPLVSVVITCYNHGHFLGEAIESALGQSYPHVEVIVVDDGSTDDAPAVAAGYDGVRTVWQPNQGLSAARNTGIQEAMGDFIVFLDADDRLRPGAVEAGLACFEAHPGSAFVSGDHIRITVDGALLRTHEPPRDEPDPYLRLLRGNYIGMHAAVLYRRTALLAAGGFDPALPACEDYDLYLRIARDASVASHETVVAEYRIHGQNMSRDAAFMLRAVLRVLHRQREAVQGEPEREEAYWEGLAIWKDYYGEELAEQLRGTLQADEPVWRAARPALALVRYAPRRLLRAGIGRGRRLARRALRATLPNAVRSRVRRVRQSVGSSDSVPSVGHVRFGDLRRLTPISRVFGFDRGTPVDRYYIEAFLGRHAADVRGRTLEIGDDTYTRRFGGERVEQADVLHAHAGNPSATFVGDLAGANDLPPNAFDCIVLTQTLHLIYDLDAAVATLYRILKPGGVLLATVPGISQIEDGEWGDTWYWSLTVRSARRLFGERFAEGTLAVEAHGNVLAAVAFLHGVAAEELTRTELDACDPLYPMLITVRAQKASGEGT
jgi:glycosyltransferase involved in cell wall biosynthesis